MVCPAQVCQGDHPVGSQGRAECGQGHWEGPDGHPPLKRPEGKGAQHQGEADITL